MKISATSVKNLLKKTKRYFICTFYLYSIAKYFIVEVEANAQHRLKGKNPYVSPPPRLLAAMRPKGGAEEKSLVYLGRCPRLLQPGFQPVILSQTISKPLNLAELRHYERSEAISNI